MNSNSSWGAAEQETIEQKHNLGDPWTGAALPPGGVKVNIRGSSL